MANRDVEGWMKSAKFIVGVYNVEDMIQIPGTRWIIGSGVINNGPGMADKFILKDYLHVFDAETETGRRVEPEEFAIQADKASFPDTTTPPDWETFSPHGIGLGKRDGDVITLYVVNHGVREAVEVFKIDVSGKRPHFPGSAASSPRRTASSMRWRGSGARTGSWSRRCLTPSTRRAPRRSR